MNKYLVVAILFCFVYGNTAAQQNKELFTYDNIPVDTDEFVYVYEKNNLNDTDLYSEESINDYLDLYVNFKLKVREAESMGLDETEAFQQEFMRYKKQLAQTYLNDRQISDDLIKEAYDRMKEERKVAHILQMCPPDTPPKDTARIFKDMSDIRKEILSGGKTFEKAARVYSEDTMVNLGYFTVFQTVYPFENAMYNTSQGEVSEVTRTQFGYHLVKVDDAREAKGKVEVAYILLKVPKRSDETMKNAIQEKIYGIYDSLNAGVPFEKMARKYSEDKSTAFNGGRWKWLSTGDALARFENVAFSLEKSGDFAEPILTSNGWYIIKLLNKRNIGTYDEMKSEIQRKILRDSRSESAKNIYIDKLKKEYKYKVNQTGYIEYTDRIDIVTLNRGNWKKTTAGADIDDPLFTLGEQTFTQQDFGTFIEQNQNRKEVKGIKTAIDKIDWLYNAFLEKELLTMEENQLEEKYPEFKRLLKEYRDGIILFELTKEKVWDKAASDTIGLDEFYEQNKQNYLYEERINAKIFNCKNEKIAQEIAPVLIKRENKRKRGKSHKSMTLLLSKFNIDRGVSEKVTYEEGTFAKGDNEIVDAIEWNEGISRTFENEDGTVTFVLVEDIIKPSPKPLEECRGFVISDYNDELEKKWVTSLKEKYPIKINKEVLKSLYKK